MKYAIKRNTQLRVTSVFRNRFYLKKTRISSDFFLINLNKFQDFKIYCEQVSPKSAAQKLLQ